MYERSGYVISIVSVLMLAIVAWDGADEDWLRVLTVVGGLTSILGMGLRWLSWEREERPSRSAPDPAARATPAAPEPSPPHRARARSGHPA